MTDDFIPVTPERAAKVLNRVHTSDPTVLPKLISFRVPCNDDVTEDPTVQVGYIDEDRNKGCEVGLLGILNGIFGTKSDGYGYLAANFDDKGELTGFIADRSVRSK